MTPAQLRRQKITAGVLLFLGLALTLFGVQFISQAEDSADWPSVEGTVQSVTVKRKLDAGRTNSSGSGRYFYTVNYRYEIAGQQRTASRFSLGDGNRAGKMYRVRTDAERAANLAYPRGSKITVYYNPSDPDSTVIQQGTNWGTYVPLILGLLFMGSGAFLFRLTNTIEQKQANEAASSNLPSIFS